MLSTYNQPNLVPICQKYNEGNYILKPTVVREYNLHMGGVDRIDQQLHNVNLLRKSYKWYKKLVFRLMAQVILNSHKIYVFTTGSNITFLDFTQKTIIAWITAS